MTKKRLQDEIDQLKIEVSKLQTEYNTSIQKLGRLEQSYDNSRHFDPIRRYLMMKEMIKEATEDISTTPVTDSRSK